VVRITLATTKQKKHKMGDCGLNCDFNAGVIDSFYRQTYQEREKQQKKDPNYQKMMAPIRRTHICCVCNKYPGDGDYMFGTWQGGRYKCFDCH
jgi:hypothetical protein